MSETPEAPESPEAPENTENLKALDDGSRPVHRLTPLLKLWTVFVALIAIVAVNLNASALATIGSFLTGEGSLIPLLLGLGGVVVVSLAVWGLSHAWWKATRYTLTDEEVILQKGVLSKQLRSARYDRIQAVDVAESVLARIFRVASVRIETAGGSQSSIEISYLTKPTAEELRTELLAYVRGTPEGGAKGTPTASDTADADSPAEPMADGPVVVERIPASRVLASLALNLSNIIGVLVVAVLLVLSLITPLGLTVAVPALIGVLPTLWKFLNESWGFTASLTPSGYSLDVTYGLADRRRQTIPLHRIHAVSIGQPILWRYKDWWRVRVSIAGYGDSTDSKTGSTTLLPVGDRETAMRLVELVGPLGRGELEEHAAPEGHRNPDFLSPARAKWVSPIDLKQQSVTLVGDVSVCHSGRLSRSVSLIDNSHIQELTLVRGPIQHLFHLCNVRFDLVSGPVNMAGQDLDVEDGRELLDALRKRELPSLESYSGAHDEPHPESPLDEPGPPPA